MTAPTPAVERMARELAGLEPGEAWPTNAALGGNLTGTRDDEFRAAMEEDARNWLTAALTDPDDPDSLARTLYVLHLGAQGVPAKHALDLWTAVPDSRRVHWRAVADGLRMMITGSGS